MKSKDKDFWLYSTDNRWVEQKMYNIFSSSSYSGAWQIDQGMQNHQHVWWQIQVVRDGNRRTAERVGHALGQRSELVNRVPVQQMQGRHSVMGIMRNYRGICLGAPFSRQFGAAQVIHKATRVTGLGYSLFHNTDSSFLGMTGYCHFKVPNMPAAENTCSIIRQNNLKGSQNSESKLVVLGSHLLHGQPGTNYDCDCVHKQNWAGAAVLTSHTCWGVMITGPLGQLHTDTGNTEFLPKLFGVLEPLS